MSPLSAAVAALALVLFSASSVSAQQETGAPIYAGCVSASYSLENPITVPRVITSGNACATACWDEYYNIFAYFQRSSNTCFCSSTGPDAGTNLAASDNFYRCAVTTDYAAYVTSTTYEFDGCYLEPIVSTADTRVGLNLEECFQAFGAGNLAVVMYTDYNGGGPLCLNPNNGGGLAYGQTKTCGGSTGANTAYIYIHAPQGRFVGGPSGYIKKRSRERLVREQNTLKALCPSPLTACRVGENKGFECIDTHYELESCGGCSNGLFGNATATGVDCTALKGPVLGGITCLNGQCVASACERGWKLVGDECVGV